MSRDGQRNGSQPSRVTLMFYESRDSRDLFEVVKATASELSKPDMGRIIMVFLKHLSVNTIRKMAEVLYRYQQVKEIELYMPQ